MSTFTYLLEAPWGQMLLSALVPLHGPLLKWSSFNGLLSILLTSSKRRFLFILLAQLPEKSIGLAPCGVN